MIFSELYGTYYRTVAEVLKTAITHPVTDKDIYSIVRKVAFDESTLTIPTALKDGRWSLLQPDGTTLIHNVPTLPMTVLQKRWLKAISLDPRIRLFTDQAFADLDVEPLFYPEDICIFDQYNDGDDFESEEYIAVFRLLLRAIEEKSPVMISMRTKNGSILNRIVLPKYLEYSEKDNKFRLKTTGNNSVDVINVGKIIKCEPCKNAILPASQRKRRSFEQRLVVELTDERNALERVLLHFAHLKKQVEKLDDLHYTITLFYDTDDETEILIRILSFGPKLKVISPRYFVELIKQRLLDQKSCEQ